MWEWHMGWGQGHHRAGVRQWQKNGDIEVWGYVVVTLEGWVTGLP